VVSRSGESVPSGIVKAQVRQGRKVERAVAELLEHRTVRLDSTWIFQGRGFARKRQQILATPIVGTGSVAGTSDRVA